MDAEWECAKEFTVMLLRARDAKYELNDVEWMLVYRVLHDTFNPRARLWATGGAVLGLLCAKNAVAAHSNIIKKVLGCTIGCLYSHELSWSFRDRHPAQRFFVDLRGVEGALGSFSPVQCSADVASMPLAARAGRFLMLGSTLGVVWNYLSLEAELGVPSSVLAAHRSLRARLWVLLLQNQLKSHPDPVVRSFWERKVSCFQRTTTLVFSERQNDNSSKPPKPP